MDYLEGLKIFVDFFKKNDRVKFNTTETKSVQKPLHVRLQCMLTGCKYPARQKKKYWAKIIKQKHLIITLSLSRQDLFLRKFNGNIYMYMYIYICVLVSRISTFFISEIELILHKAWFSFWMNFFIVDSIPTI